MVIKALLAAGVLSLSLACTLSSDRDRTNPSKSGEKQNYQTITGDDTATSRNQWDKFFDTPSYVYGRDPIPFLKEHVERLRVGKALVLAMGEGRNAVFLARKGFQVEGIDISEVALRKARRLAKEYSVTVDTVTGSIKDYPIRENHYDFILDVEYFRASVIDRVKKGLKRGGYVMFENFLVEQLQNPEGMSVQQNFLVKRGELKELFHDFEILIYKETNDGKQAVAQLLARKP